MNPVNDMLIRIKNAYRAGHETVVVPYSKFRYEIAKALEKKGFVGKMERKGKRVRKTIEATLIYDKDGAPALSGVKFISKPSRRLYTSYRTIPRGQQDTVLILSTPKGVMSGEEARKAKVGGEMIAEIW